MQKNSVPCHTTMSLQTEYGQHYTDEIISAALIGHLKVPAPRNVIDIGVGQGSLLASAAQRWVSATLIGIDLDPRNVEHTRTKLTGSQIHHGDALMPDVLAQLGYAIESMDLALCNPPFTKRNIAPNELAARLGLQTNDLLLGNEIELAFLSRNLEHLRKKGTLGIILPDCYISGRRYQSLRKALLETHAIEAVVELPRRTFSTAEVAAHFMVIKKEETTEQTALYQLSEKATWSTPLHISKADAIERLDYSYHLMRSQKQNSGSSLAELGADIRRGSHSMADAERAGLSIFHTTSFKNFPDKMVSWWSKDQELLGLRAAPGDILLPRVGSRCLHYCALVQKGTPLLSDCVYRLRVPDAIRQPLWNYLSSQDGITARLGIAYGSCAKIINKASLLELVPTLS